MPAKNFNEITHGAIKTLANTTNITQLGRGAKARSMLEIIGGELVTVAQSIQNEIKQGRLSDASRRRLDLIADLFNITRLRRSKAIASFSDINVMFKTAPHIADFSSLSSIPSISTGTVLMTRGATPIRYLVSELSGPLKTDENTYIVGVEAETSGASSNIGRNVLTQHPYGIENLLVTNTYPIANGRNDESDDQFRFRIFNAVRSLESSNNTAIFLAARIVPGVGDIQIINNLFGIGTTAVLIRPVIGGTVPGRTRFAVETSIQATLPTSSKVFVMEPDLAGFEFEIVINYKEPMNATEKATIETKAVSLLHRYFRALRIGTRVDWGRVTSIISNIDPKVSHLGHTEGIFGRVWVYHSIIPGSLERRREEIIITEQSKAFSIPRHGLALLEESITNPVRITHGTEG